MTWRGSTNPTDRIVASLLYFLPFLDSLRFDTFFFAQFPELEFLVEPFEPIANIYHSFLGFGIFLAVFLLIVRNENLSHFIRFNGMQAILIGILLSLIGIAIQYIILPVLQEGLLLETLFNVIFLGTLTAVIYSVVQCALGRYPELPALSDAVYMQVR